MGHGLEQCAIEDDVAADPRIDALRDNLIGLEGEFIGNQRRVPMAGTLGLGYANIGGLLMNMGLGYDSAEGRALGGALSRRRAGARAPAIVLQLMLLPVGWFMIEGGMGWLGVPLMALGIGMVGLLVSGPTNRALGFGEPAG